jgi:hypothetical protein
LLNIGEVGKEAALLSLVFGNIELVVVVVIVDDAANTM